MDKPILLRPSVWLGTFVICSLVICWALSMRRIDFVTWTIGPGRGGDRVAQLGVSVGVASLFFGESGLSREPGFHYDSRVLASDEDRGTWLPKFLSFESSRSGLNIEIAIWFLIVVCAVSWLLWTAWRRAWICRIRNNSVVVPPKGS